MSELDDDAISTWDCWVCKTSWPVTKGTCDNCIPSERKNPTPARAREGEPPTDPMLADWAGNPGTTLALREYRGVAAKVCRYVAQEMFRVRKLPAAVLAREPDLAEKVIGWAQELEDRDAPTSTREPDAVNHPEHYQLDGIEVIDVIDGAVSDPAAYYHGAVIKYVCRARHKGACVEDLRKARWYLDRLIERLEGA